MVCKHECMNKGPKSIELATLSIYVLRYTYLFVPAYHPTQTNMLTARSTGMISDTAFTSPIIDRNTPLPALK